MADTYRTIAAAAEGLYKDKGSKFLAFAHPVETLDEVREWLDLYHKQYYDARHCCYAYVLGAGDGDSSGCMGLEYRANDDGEPSGTAGRPILGQINSLGLTNILVVVIRYFGGILLGTGGLIVAYKEATQDALSHAELVTRDILIEQELTFTYDKMSAVMRIIRDTETRIAQQTYTEQGECVMRLWVRKAHANAFLPITDPYYGQD